MKNNKFPVSLLNKIDSVYEQANVAVKDIPAEAIGLLNFEKNSIPQKKPIVTPKIKN